ncbi:chromosome assembly factor 1, putative [Plasmodium gallinaceum]|uniref:Protein HIRA n=1 Tax=Plasmodium gallinaceum TaxID=5849 RepID=A0A1J1H2S8_PLAGA|nr:chromosome assembly factor 1, putative [Plasmodium gallinaceum]CRG97795.1 chromosome assembly factor 1, putative [Plasmodium gallinaceum]
MPNVYLPQILWHSKDNKRSDRIYSIDIQPYPNYYSVKKLHKKYESFKKFLKEKKKDDMSYGKSEEKINNNISTLKVDNDIDYINTKCTNNNEKTIINDNTINDNLLDSLKNDNNINDLIKEDYSKITSLVSETNSNTLLSENNIPSIVNKKKGIKFNIATCGADEFIHLWRVYIKEDLSIKCLSRFIGHNGEINCVRFNKNGRYLASGGEDKFLYVWEKSKKPRNIPLGYDISFLDYKEWWTRVGSFRCSGVINSIIWSNNDTLYIGNEDNNINIIDFVKNTNCKIKVLEGHTGMIQGISIDTNNEFLASLSADQTLKIWKKKIDGKSWKLENSIKNIKRDELEKRNTGFISDEECEDNEKYTEKNENNTCRKEGKKETERTQKGNHELSEQEIQEKKKENWNDEEQEKQEREQQIDQDKQEGEYERTKIQNQEEQEDEDEDEEEEEEEKKLKRCLFSSEEMLPSFFRRIDFSPNGEFLVAPSGIQFEQVEKINEKNTKSEENTKPNYQIKAYSCFYIYHKNLFIKYNIPFFTIFSQTSHFLVAKFNYNTFKLRTHQNILKRCYKHLINSKFDTDDVTHSNKKRRVSDETLFFNELKNNENIIKLNYEKTLLFNDFEIHDDVSQNVSSTITDSDREFNYEKNSYQSSSKEYILSDNFDKTIEIENKNFYEKYDEKEEEKKEKEEDEEEDEEEKEYEDEDENDNEDEENDQKNEENEKISQEENDHKNEENEQKNEENEQKNEENDQKNEENEQKIEENEQKIEENEQKIEENEKISQEKNDHKNEENEQKNEEEKNERENEKDNHDSGNIYIKKENEMGIEKENVKKLNIDEHKLKNSIKKKDETIKTTNYSSNIRNDDHYDEKTNDIDMLCGVKDKKEERFIYALGTFDGSVYFYDSEILDTPISIVKNMHLCPITDISWNNLGNICACSSSDGYVSFYYFHKNELGNIKSYKNYYFDKKCNDLTFDQDYFENIFYDEVEFLNKNESNDYTSSEDDYDEDELSLNKEEPKVKKINLIVGNAANFVLEQNTKK